jgi:hypothetical protein
MPSTATITGKTGPGLAVTALVIQDVSSVAIETYPRSMVKVNAGLGTKEFDIQADTTLTATLAAGVLAITFS